MTAVAREHWTRDAIVIREPRRDIPDWIEQPEITVQTFRIPNVRGDALAVRREREIVDVRSRPNRAQRSSHAVHPRELMDDRRRTINRDDAGGHRESRFAA